MWTYILYHTPLLYLVQSLWRDEAFSVLAAQQSLPFIVTRLGFEPPVYYTLLHIWIRIFGSGEIAARSLSFIGFLLATVVVIEWSSQIYKKHWLSWFVPLFFFLNPMMLYYAFEVRTYGWYAFFSTAMLYAYTTKKWPLFMLMAVLGFYTHVYLIVFIGALFLYSVWMHRASFSGLFRSKHTFSVRLRSLVSHLANQRDLRAFVFIGLGVLPWLIKIGREAGRMRDSWYFPVNLQLVRSALGNIFLGYEGTPWYGWIFTQYLSLVIAGCALFSLTDKKNKSRNQLFILFGALPLGLIIGISFVKPVFVNRYLLPSTIAEVLLVGAALAAIRNRWLQKTAAAAALAGVVWFNWWYPPQHAKLPVREAFEQINMLAEKDDIILASNPIIYLETLYYAKDASKVYLYNPENGVFPWYVGDALITPSRMLRDYPTYPQRAILVNTDATYSIIYRLPL